ncbi:MAG: 4Fe-4S dicluster domain-containing protein [Clostridia bacterium]|nr:4Fe-4S dicluster domain-containing protein [Clostridia bacterium]
MKLVKDLSALYEAIAAVQELYLPVENKGRVDFKLYEAGANVDIKTLKTVRSAKDFFFTQTETLMGFKVEGKNIEVEDLRPEVRPFVAFGVRGCDARSFEVLDKVFLVDPVDTVYEARRKAGTVVTLACGRPEETCFCTNFGITPEAPAGDVTTWLTEEGLYWQANTDKGEALTAAIAAVFTEGDGKAVEEQKKAISDIIAKLPLANLDMTHLEGVKEETFWGHPVWKDISETCLACGTCTYVCPTCQCYDVRDFDCGNGIERFRCWDSCMYSDFTRMAHGNNRNTQDQRCRQRYLHKLVYFPRRNEGMFGCVGCGRCVAKCPSKLNIVKVIKALGGK